MRILIAHNRYQQRGGEDAAVEAEVALLRRHGHDVNEYRRHNDEVAGIGGATVAANALWSRRTTHELAALLADTRPEVLHVHNTFPLISPSLYWAAARAQVPVVQTVHNFRLACPQAMFLREGRLCEDCLGHMPWRAVLHGCYRGSRAQSLVVASTVQVHRMLGTWQHKVARWIALSRFSRDKLIAAGLPADRIVVGGQFVEPPADAAGTPRERLLFVGRLAPEKGLSVLAEALALCPGVEVDVIGSGPESSRWAATPGLRLLGALAPLDVMKAMQAARALVLPSIVYENFPRTLVEAYACATPVIASRLGALGELVTSGRTGLSFAAGDAHALAVCLRQAMADPQSMAQLGAAARSQYDERYAPEPHHRALMDIYCVAVEEADKGRSR